MNVYHGQCQCGQVKVSVTLPKRLSDYQPRACDCDFCTQRMVAYLSDPSGKAVIQSTGKLLTLKQGSEQAGFLACPSCKSIMATSCEIDGQLKGAVNANMLADKALSGESQVASPKLLAPEQKQQRWAQLWLPLSLETK